MGKESICSETDSGDMGLIPGLGRHGRRRAWQYSCLENPMDRGAWKAAAHGVIKESDLTETTEHAHMN